MGKGGRNPSLREAAAHFVPECRPFCPHGADPIFHFAGQRSRLRPKVAELGCKRRG